MASLAVASMFMLSLQPHTTIILGLVERDLTGDGRVERLRVVGTGPTLDNLDAEFTIEAAGTTTYRHELRPLTRAVGFDAGRRVITAEEHWLRLNEFGKWFFADEKFQRPSEFVDSFRASAPRILAETPEVIARDQRGSDTRSGAVIWEEILASPALIFTFSPGGDTVVAIGWSPRAGRFYQLLECC